MTSLDAGAGRLRARARRARTLVVGRLLARMQASGLDEDLAAGMRPAASVAHRLRADHLGRTRVRQRMNRALVRAVADAGRPVHRGTPQAPLSRQAIRTCREGLLALAASVATLENPRTQGLAITYRLAFDGRGPLFFQPDARDRVERLANTVQAAQAALRVSPEFDELVWSEAPDGAG